MNTVSRDHVAIVESFYQRLTTGDVAGALANFHRDSEIDEPDGLPYGGRYQGHRGILQLFMNVAAHFHLEIRQWELHATGEEVVGIITTTFTSKATGKVLHTTAVELYRFADGRISSVDIYPKDTRAIYELSRSD